MSLFGKFLPIKKKRLGIIEVYDHALGEHVWHNDDEYDPPNMNELCMHYD
jgi:hypothetical protein